MDLRVGLRVLILVLVWAPGFAPAQSFASSSDAAARCMALRGADFSNVPDAPTQITEAKLLDAAGGQPAQCRAIGYVSPAVGFELRLPLEWNGKFIQVGSGGHAGVFDWIKWCPMSRGYACLVTDMGHEGMGTDAVWAKDNLQAKVDFAFRATHVATLAGKAIVAKYYEKAPVRSYFMGCSTGGRQALQGAQRFPWDYDGIIAGAPPIDLASLYVSAAWNYLSVRDDKGAVFLGPKQLEILRTAAVARCDLDDGVKDGIIGDPRRCAADPAQLACGTAPAGQCLTPDQIVAAKKLYSGPTRSNGQSLDYLRVFPGAEPIVGDPEGRRPVAETMFADGLRYLFFWPAAGAGWQLKDFDFDRDPQRLALTEALVDSSNPDLRRFKAAGGKLIIFQGLNDPLLASSAIEYYETVERTMGGREATQSFTRLFELPGVEHCSGGAGADAADFLGALEAWVERGQAPDRILTGHLKEKSPEFAYPYRVLPSDASLLAFTRPAYPYPLRAKYKGKGDPNDASNYGPVAPPRARGGQ